MHLDEDRLQRLRHGELSPAMETAARQHVAECAECRGRVAAAERDETEVFGLLRELDHPTPQIDAETVAARARGRGHGRGVSAMRWAAGIVLVLGLAGAAYAAPGSPLPTWVETVVEWASGRPDRAPAPSPGVAGIAVAPGPRLVIVFTAPQATGQAQVSLTDGADVVVRVLSGAATFTTDVDRLVIDNQGSATFEIQIPRTAPRVEIRVGGQRVFLKERSRVTTDTVTDMGGPYVLPLVPPGP